MDLLDLFVPVHNWFTIVTVLLGLVILLLYLWVFLLSVFCFGEFYLRARGVNISALTPTLCAEAQTVDASRAWITGFVVSLFFLTLTVMLLCYLAEENPAVVFLSCNLYHYLFICLFIGQPANAKTSWYARNISQILVDFLVLLVVSVNRGFAGLV